MEKSVQIRALVLGEDLLRFVKLFSTAAHSRFGIGDDKAAAFTSSHSPRGWRKNHLTLISKRTTCEMDVVSNYSGWEHNDQGDFKQRVDESLAKLSTAKPAQPVKPQETNK
jgi:hypothetical protein